MIKSGKIKEIQIVSEGISGGRKWTLYKLIFDDNFICTTFDGIYTVDQQVNLSVEKMIKEGKNGIKYENWQVIPSKPKKESVIAQNSKFEEIMKALGEIQAQLVNLQDEVVSLDVPRIR